MSFSPFDKAIGETLTPVDLQLLVSRGVREGYYVEYKSTFPENRKVARSIASLANTYGGWYFVGVATDAHNVANDICGFSLKDCPDPISRLTELLKSNMDPSAAFYPQLVHLTPERAVLAVYVPPDQETPFVTLDGRVYRRVNDSSDPAPEANRATLDRLYETGRERRRRFADFCRDERSFSRAQEDQVWVSLYLSPYACAPLNRWRMVTSEGMQELLSLSREQAMVLLLDGGDHISGNLPLNFAQPTHRSVILRQVQPQQSGFASMTVELFMDGSAKFHIPVQKQRWVSPQDLPQLESDALRQVLTEMLLRDIENLRVIQWVDAGLLNLIVASFLAFYEAWLGEEKKHMELKAAIRVDNVWRCVPYFDADEWADCIRDFGLPVLERTDIDIPDDLGEGFRFAFDDSPLWAKIFLPLGLALGIPADRLAASFGTAFLRHATHQETPR